MRFTEMRWIVRCMSVQPRIFAAAAALCLCQMGSGAGAQTAAAPGHTAPPPQAPAAAAPGPAAPPPSGLSGPDDPAKVAAAREFILVYHPAADPKQFSVQLDRMMPRMVAI